MSKEYEVTLPITGKAYLTVVADSEEEAIQIALGEVLFDHIAIQIALGEVLFDHIEEWEAVERINEGNVCYAMRPWQAEAVEMGNE